MDSELGEFFDRVRHEWLPSFCSARAPEYQPEGFDEKTLDRIGRFDAHWFLNAIGAGLVEEKGGFFSAPKSAAKEQIFWQGNRNDRPRKLTLWAEPIITIGACARLREEYEWPEDCIGMQSKYPWPFDLVCYPLGTDQEIVACEVKKSSAEINKLIEHMQTYCNVDLPKDEPKNSVEKNAYRKVMGIRRSWPTLFWALGPNGAGHCFKIGRIHGSERFSMNKVDEKELQFGNLA